MAFQKISVPGHYVVQLDDTGDVEVITLRTIDHVIDTDTGFAVSDQTAIETVVDFANMPADLTSTRVALADLYNRIGRALTRCGQSAGAAA